MRGRAEVEEIDELNILQATLLTIRHAMSTPEPPPQQVLVNDDLCPDLSCSAKAIATLNACHQHEPHASLGWGSMKKGPGPVVRRVRRGVRVGVKNAVSKPLFMMPMSLECL